MKVLVLASAFVLALGNEGRYAGDNSGRYVSSGDEGRYYPDDSGKYIHDGMGNYLHDGTGRYDDLNDKYKRDNRVVVRTTTPKPTPPPTPPIVYKTYEDEGHWKVLRQLDDFDTSGGYHWEYDTENKINAEESGKLFKQGAPDEGIKAKGFYTYVGPDNLVYDITYTADENGFIPTGRHIPTPPPIPDAILRALKYKNLL